MKGIKCIYYWRIFLYTEEDKRPHYHYTHLIHVIAVCRICTDYSFYSNPYMQNISSPPASLANGHLTCIRSKCPHSLHTSAAQNFVGLRNVAHFTFQNIRWHFLFSQAKFAELIVAYFNVCYFCITNCCCYKENYSRKRY